METSLRLGLQVDPCLPRSLGEHSREVWVEVCCRGLLVQRRLIVKLYTLFRTQDLEKDTLFSGTYLYRPNKGVPPTPPPPFPGGPRYIGFQLHVLKETVIPNTAKVKFYFRCNQYPRNIWHRARIKILCFLPTDSKARVTQNSFTCSVHAVENT